MKGKARITKDERKLLELMRQAADEIAEKEPDFAIKSKDLHIFKRITFVIDENGKLYREDCDGYVTKKPSPDVEVPTDWYLVVPVGKFLTRDQAIRKFAKNTGTNLTGRYAHECLPVSRNEAYQLQER